MASLLRMPAISADIAEAVLNEWPVAESSAFAAGDPIATVETDKAVVDVPAEADGVLVRTLVAPGKAVSVGTPMAVLAAPGEVIDDVDALVAQLVGETAGRTVLGRVFASPLARRLAREHGLRVEDIRGTGPGGRIVRDDVRRALTDRPTADAAAPADPDLAPAPDPAPARPATTPPAAAVPGPVAAAHSGGGPAARYDVVPHSRTRRAIASRLADSARETPVFTIRGSARVDALLALRRQVNEATGVKISLNDLVVAAAARAHAAVPAMNVVWTADAVHQFHDVDVAIAVPTGKGLVTPVIRRVSELTVSTLARTSADLVARARAGRLRQDELEGGALTVTNLGVFGTEEFTAVINPPQAAILAVGAAREEAVVVDGQLGVATVLRVTLSVDHRPVDGALAAEWMAHFLGLLEAPVRILA